MQIFFDFTPPPQEEPISKRHLKLALRRATLKWLLDQDPMHRPAIGVDVTIKGSSLKADVAAAWLETARTKTEDGNSTLLLVPRNTVVVICLTERSECWPQCVQARALLKEIALIKAKLKITEASIRKNEPELREQQALFDEYAAWNYRATKNPDYLNLLKQKKSCEEVLFKGSRLTQICNAHAANKIFLAVPEGTIGPNEVKDSWGLLVVNTNTLDVKLAKEPVDLDSPPAIQSALTMAIADCATKHVAQCHGIRLNDDKTTTVVKMPIVRRKPLDTRKKHDHRHTR